MMKKKTIPDRAKNIQIGQCRPPGRPPKNNAKALTFEYYWEYDEIEYVNSASGDEEAPVARVV